MGLHAGDLVREIADTTRQLPGVRGVWALKPTDRDASVWVMIRGTDPESHENLRFACVKAVQGILRAAREDMRSAGVVLDYEVTTDGPDLRAWLMEQGARPVTG